MAKRQNKVSVNTIDKMAKNGTSERKIIKYRVGEDVVDIEVKPYITLQERGQLVSDIADAVYINGTYAPYMLGFAYKYSLIEYFTNLSIPQNPEKINDLVHSTDIILDIEEIICDDGIYSDALDLIEYRKNVYLKNNKADELFETLTSLLKNLDKVAASDIGKENPTELLSIARKLADKDDGALVEKILDIRDAKAKKAKI